MKKLIFSLILLVLSIPCVLMAAGTVTDDRGVRYSPAADPGEYSILFTCTADSGDGSYPSFTSSVPINGFVYLVTVVFGGTAPTSDATDVTLTDSDDVPILGGTLDDMDTTANLQAVPLIGQDSYGARYVSGLMSLDIADNTETSAVMYVKVYFYR
jgi:hypothetical protein